MSNPDFRDLYLAIFYFVASVVFFSFTFIFKEWTRSAPLLPLDIGATWFFFRMGWFTLKRWENEQKEK